MKEKGREGRWASDVPVYSINMAANCATADVPVNSINMTVICATAEASLRFMPYSSTTASSVFTLLPYYRAFRFAGVTHNEKKRLQDCKPRIISCPVIFCFWCGWRAHNVDGGMLTFLSLIHI